MYHDNHNIAIFKFDSPHMLQPILRSGNRHFWLDCKRHTSGPQFNVFNMAVDARHEANLMNFVQESAKNDKIKPKNYYTSACIIFQWKRGLNNVRICRALI